MKYITIAVVLLVMLWIGNVWAHDYAAPFFYKGGVYAYPDERGYPPATDEEMDWLLKQITDDDKNVRYIAAGALGQTKDPRAVEPLLKALNDTDRMVRMNAAMSFVHISDTRSMEPLKSLIERQDNYTGMAAIYALAAQGDAGIDVIRNVFASAPQSKEGEPGISVEEFLAQAMLIVRGDNTTSWAVDTIKSLNKTNRKLALRMLFFSNEDKANLSKTISDEALMKIILDIALSSTEDESEMAVDILVSSKNKAAIDRLIEAAKDDSRKDQGMLLSALRLSPDPSVKEKIASIKEREDESSSLNDAEIVRLIQEVRKARAYPEDSRNAAEKLVSSGGSKAINALAEVLNGTDQAAAETVLYTFAHSGKQNASDLVAEIAKNPKHKLHSQAVRASVHLWRSDLLPIYHSLLNDEDEDLVMLCTKVIGSHGDKTSTKPLVAMLANPRYRWLAVRTLGELKDPSAIAEIIPLFDIEPEPEDYEPSTVVTSLAEFGSAVVEPLIPKLKSPSVKMRLGVSQVFQRVKDARTIEPLIAALGDSNTRVRESVIEALLEQGDPKGIEAVISLYRDKNPKVRKMAAYAAIQAPCPNHANDFMAMLKDQDRDVRRCGGIALGLIGDNRGADVIIKALTTDQDDQYDGTGLFLPAVRAAGKLKDKRALETIINVLGSDVSMSTTEGISQDQNMKARDTKLEAARAITGQDFGYAYYRWTAYWIAQGN